LEDLTKLFEQHCKDDDRRHEENVALLKANTDAIAAQNKVLEKLAKRVDLMSPGGTQIVRLVTAGLSCSRSRESRASIAASSVRVFWKFSTVRARSPTV
jgi:ABC-type uncharacterized transport system ATPase component